jgi:hypothetical protein
MRSKYFMRISSLAVASYDLWRVGFAKTRTLCARAKLTNTMAPANGDAFIGSPRIDVVVSTHTTMTGIS